LFKSTKNSSLAADSVYIFFYNGHSKCSKISHNTISGIKKIFSLKLKNQVYGNGKNQIIQNAITVYWVHFTAVQILKNFSEICMRAPIKKKQHKNRGIMHRKKLLQQIVDEAVNNYDYSQTLDIPIEQLTGVEDQMPSIASIAVINPSFDLQDSLKNRRISICFLSYLG
jgi:hypothetical protein